ncbi:hypothetical protein [Bacillus toyonensis]|uniref:hypothetical protein n=1 Tax=Bacillus toyonensis TaxID=155322 RepID=UPI000BFAAFEB|nr:hypothetical protein [Bacillus toyonensis]PGF05037.1 hypothetical protein COM61_00965 [Bacillus toyonensis]
MNSVNYYKEPFYLYEFKEKHLANHPKASFQTIIESISYWKLEDGTMLAIDAITADIVPFKVDLDQYSRSYKHHSNQTRRLNMGRLSFVYSFFRGSLEDVMCEEGIESIYDLIKKLDVVSHLMKTYISKQRNEDITKQMSCLLTLVGEEIEKELIQENYTRVVELHRLFTQFIGYNANKLPNSILNEIVSLTKQYIKRFTDGDAFIELVELSDSLCDYMSTVEYNKGIEGKYADYIEIASRDNY